MPTYGYECKSCKHTFDVFQSMKDEPIKICPECGKAVRRLINGGNGVIFKGSGFYVTDKAGKPGAKGGKNGDESKAPKTADPASAPCPGCPKANAKGESCPQAANS